MSHQTFLMLDLSIFSLRSRPTHVLLPCLSLLSYSNLELYIYIISSIIIQMLQKISTQKEK
ncbi:hypothetical protein CDL12_09230 [Handroanthus impetiginosus]|uniref:Uncharacterized protein n=1 Tax=Handroanthus impetiginosus TaxID=429701 RepID=A0A2G9HKR7_9LAMI|nr:hypothetical protein CDL12_09230 [Handroanthus impetiginosus]